MNNWKKYKLGELGILARGKSKNRPRDAEHLYGGKYPFIQTGDIKNANHKIYSYTQTYSEAGLAQSKLWDEGTICITIAANIGDTAILTFKGCFPDSVLGFVADKEKCDVEFIEYMLQFYKRDIQLHSIGSVQDNINLGTFQNIEFKLPPLPTQTRIASILSSLDDKIELNRRMNQTLEQMAQTLFKKYFVDDIDKDNLSEGWRWEKLENIISIKHGYAFEGRYFTEEVNENILLTPGNFKIGGGFNYNKFKYYNGIVPKDYILQKNDLIVTMTDLSKDGDSLGYSSLTPFIAGKKLLHNQRIGKVIYKETEMLKFYFYWLMRSDAYRAFVLGGATGTTVKHTSPTRICEYSCAIPPETTLIEFNKLIEGLIEKEMRNQNEIETLAKVRDTLLPKLMSGEIEVDCALLNIDQNVQECDARAAS